MEVKMQSVYPQRLNMLLSVPAFDTVTITHHIEITQPSHLE